MPLPAPAPAPERSERSKSIQKQSLLVMMQKKDQTTNNQHQHQYSPVRDTDPKKDSQDFKLEDLEIENKHRHGSKYFGIEEDASEDRQVDSINPNNNGRDDADLLQLAEKNANPLNTTVIHAGKDEIEEEIEELLESETPLAFFNFHLFEQIDKRGKFKSVEHLSKKQDQPEFAKLTDLFATVTLTDFLNIDPVQETFTIKYRTFYLWKCKLEDYPELTELAEKTQKSGHFYPLTRPEVDHFTKHYHIPKVSLFNQVNTTETDVLDIRIYGGYPGKTAVMMNQSFVSVVRERFILHHFPFDLQKLVLDFRLNDARTWNFYKLQIAIVQFHQDCLHQLEWNICIPSVKKGTPKTANSKVIIPIQRKVGYYIQNVILIIIMLTALGLSTFAFESEDLVGRTFVVITLILTCIAFKFTALAESLPKVPYSTLMDNYMVYGIWCLAIMTVFTIIPAFYVENEEHPGIDNTINLALSMASIGLVVIGFGILLIISLWTLHTHFQHHCIIPLDKNRPWYAFIYCNPSFLPDLDPKKTLEDTMIGDLTSVNPDTAKSFWNYMTNSFQPPANRNDSKVVRG